MVGIPSSLRRKANHSHPRQVPIPGVFLNFPIDLGHVLQSAANKRFGEEPHVSVISYNRSVLLVGQAPDAKTKAEVERIVRGVESVRSVLDEVIVGSATSLSTRSNDALITSKVKARFIDANKFNVLNVKVVTENGVVYLLDLVNKKEANYASDIARTTSGVQKVVRVFEYVD